MCAVGHALCQLVGIPRGVNHGPALKEGALSWCSTVEATTESGPSYLGAHWRDTLLSAGLVEKDTATFAGSVFAELFSPPSTIWSQHANSKISE